MNLRESIIRNRRSAAHPNDLSLIFKCLYPHLQVVNPFEDQLYKDKYLTKREKRIILEMIRVSVLVNKNYRYWDNWMRLHATEEDYINALSLAERELRPKKPKVLLTTAVRRFLVEIISRYGGSEFTFKQAREATHLSRTGTYWKMKDLESKDLIRRVGGARYTGYYYEVTEKVLL